MNYHKAPLVRGAGKTVGGPIAIISYIACEIPKKELDKYFLELFGPDKKFIPSNVLSKKKKKCIVVKSGMRV